MPNGDYVYPGAGRFIVDLGRKFGDASIVGQISRLPLVQDALQYIAGAARAPDAETRNGLLRRAARAAVPLLAAVDGIESAIEEMVNNMEGTVDPTDGKGIASLLQEAPPEAKEPMRTTLDANPPPPVARRAPVWGTPPGHAGPADPVTAEIERQAREGIDEGMSGGPARPDTGVNQRFNQVSVPSQYDQPNALEDVKQSRNPPRTEPNESDDGMGHELIHSQFEGSGMTQESMRAGVMAATGGRPPEEAPPPEAPPPEQVRSEGAERPPGRKRGK